MKLLVFAHTPPPHHGQSLMVQYMVEGFRTDPSLGIEVVHVNARLSAGMEDVGRFRPGKLFGVFGFVFQTIASRFRHGVRTFYYIPSPPKRNSLIRDWMILALCRPFFSKVILHWHAAGLGEWLEQPSNRKFGAISRWVLGGADLAMCPSAFNIPDAEKFRPKRAVAVPNGLPDPCPDFDAALGSKRVRRLPLIQKALNGAGEPVVIKAAFLAHCTHEKGLFDALEGVALANEMLASRGSAARFVFEVGGEFMDPAERVEFERRKAELAGKTEVVHHGFVTGDSKKRLLAEADVLCFPTYYSAESFSLAIAEAFAFGLPVVTTRWRSLPEFFDKDYPGLVAPRSPKEVAQALLGIFGSDYSGYFRRRFMERYEVKGHLTALAAAMRSVESDSVQSPSAPPR